MITNTSTTPASSADPSYWEGFISETEAADFLCQSVRTIQKWRVTGFGPRFYKFGRSVRYRRRELMEWVTEYTGPDETVTQATGSRVTGLRAGNVDNRQLAIYDKRTEVMQKAKDGWLAIWNAERTACGQEPLDLSDREASQVWRFELRLGSKQLRGRFEMHSWADLRERLGDAYHDALQRLRYSIPTPDSNRARWPVHELWQLFDATIGNDLTVYCCGIQPSDVIFANRTAKMRELPHQDCNDLRCPAHNRLPPHTHCILYSEMSSASHGA
ncbi:helix-turn-helix protein [Rhodobacter sp. JA431]|uniref:helix-turn-helix transcriptional regulator n=1 Tax=Rhodobacter sp. JA431 TaxID=570013 RepID=UPI000BCE2895|nr:helix-turn-helix protein [Rhodobacter sp. JA431]